MKTRDTFTSDQTRFGYILFKITDEKMNVYEDLKGIQ